MSRKKELYKAAKKYLDIKSLFPKSKIDYNNITNYQAKKISGEIKKLVERAGSVEQLKKSFVKIRRTKAAKDYLKKSGLPETARGVLLPGGEKINSDVRIKKGALHFKRGNASEVLFPLNATSEKSLLDSIKNHARWIANSENITYLSTPGGKVNYVAGFGHAAGIEGDDGEGDAVQSAMDYASILWNKYANMANQKMARSNGRIAAHPKKWGLSLLIERK